MLFHMKVAGPYLQPVSYGKAAIRETIGKAVSLFVCFLRFIWIGFDARKQGWHDKMADTYILRREMI